MSYWLQSRESVHAAIAIICATDAKIRTIAYPTKAPRSTPPSPAHRPKSFQRGAFPALGPFLKRSQAVVCHPRIPVGYAVNSRSRLATPWPCHVFVLWPHRPCLSGLELSSTVQMIAVEASQLTCPVRAAVIMHAPVAGNGRFQNYRVHCAQSQGW